MAFVFAMEVTVWNFFSSAPLVSSSLVLALFAMIPVFAARLVVAMVSLTPPSVVVPGIPRFLFRDAVNCLLVLRLISVPWL